MSKLYLYKLNIKQFYINIKFFKYETFSKSEF